MVLLVNNQRYNTRMLLAILVVILKIVFDSFTVDAFQSIRIFKCLKNTPTNTCSWIQPSYTLPTQPLSPSSNVITLSKSNNNVDVDGMQTAPYIFTFILLLSIWNFTIPTEFRRARICSEQQVIDYPESNCKTWSQYVTGIQNYYQNGGTLFKFDFSIDRENNIWITGPQEIIE